MLDTSRMWREIAVEMGKENPDIELDHLLVDSCAMHLIRRPASFDVIVTENMFGDILTDEASMLAGSMGMLPSASLGKMRADGTGIGLYEPIHGTAPDIAGQGKANPLAMILSTRHDAAPLARSHGRGGCRGGGRGRGARAGAAHARHRPGGHPQRVHARRWATPSLAALTRDS